MSNKESMGQTTNTFETTEQLQARCESLEQENAKLADKVKWLEAQFRLSQQRQFAASSEKSDPNQLSLFNEAESTADLETEEPTVEEVTVRRKKRRGNRNVQTENLPRETIEHRLPETDQVCSCCGGALHEMSTETREEIKIVPAQAKVVDHVQYVYACRHCEHHEIETPIVPAQKPEPVYPGSLASPSAMAYIMNQKYVEGLPLYRQEKQLNRLGVALSRQTMANWMIHGADQWLQPIYGRMSDHLLEQDILHADETTLQVLSEPDRPATAKSYMWMYRTGREGPPNILYDYQPSRASKHPCNFLSGFTGYLHVDGYAGYNKLPDVTLVGCWAHARRKFDEALKGLPTSKKDADVTAKEGLGFCNKLFKIERDLKEVTSGERYQCRLKRSQPVLDAFSSWLDKQAVNALPKSALGKAVNYCQKQWEKLTAYMEDGRLEIDNNRGERSIKPFVIGRKNFLFSNTPKGAQSSAIIYSIVETAKENGLKPFDYLTYLFERLPNLDTKDKETLDQLLPWSLALPDSCRIPNQQSK